VARWGTPKINAIGGAPPSDPVRIMNRLAMMGWDPIPGLLS
jgi:hypothetical protein